MSIDRIAPTQRPNDRPIGYQTWTDLSFLHWRVPVDTLRPLIPSALEIDVDADGSAWVGMVPFHMSNVRPWWSPALPWLCEFHETNLRTYVHLNGEQPGVWFFSLDAARAIPVWVARTLWHLNYHWARMSVTRSEAGINYSSRRFDGSAETQIKLSTLAPLNADRCYADGSGSSAEPESLEHFLAERYYLYTQTRDGRLLRGQVHHRAYPLRQAQLEHCQQTLTQAAGISVGANPEHVLFSPGVTVDIFRLRPIKLPRFLRPARDT